MASNGLTFTEKEPFLRLFNRGGYVLDFSNDQFNSFTEDSVGVRLSEKYGFSKGRSLERFVSDAPADQVWKLFADLLNYYENYFKEDTDADECENFHRLHQECKRILTSHITETKKNESDVSMFFNVIIRANEDIPVENSRIFEDTDPNIAARFKNQDGTPNFEMLQKLPTITSAEYDDVGSTIAQIGYLGADLSQCLSSVVASFPSTRLNRILATTGWRGSRTRWMVFKGDPYRMLGDLRSNYNPVQNEAVLQFPSVPIKEKQIAVMMPFNSAYPSPSNDPVYVAITAAADQLGYKCRRVDEINTPTDITQDILKLIESSRVVIADLSGANPNVYYEMGLAHARGRIVVPISNSKENLPFDNRQIRTIFFHSDDEYGLRGLTEKIITTLKNL